jgi:hypothetical protein
VFAFLPRLQLAEIVPQIGNWYFAEKAQYYLHECGKITLGRVYLNIRLFRNQVVPVIVNHDRKLPIPDVPIPVNVKDFKAMYIRFDFIENMLNPLLFYS